MKLVDDWKDVWKWYSTWVGVVGGFAPTVWLSVPKDLREAMPTEWLAVGGGVFFVAMLVARTIDQGAK